MEKTLDELNSRIIELASKVTELEEEKAKLTKQLADQSEQSTMWYKKTVQQDEKLKAIKELIRVI